MKASSTVSVGGFEDSIGYLEQQEASSAYPEVLEESKWVSGGFELVSGGVAD